MGGKRILFIWLGLTALIFAAGGDTLASTCYGSNPCHACHTCEYCKHCNAGGHCGVCR
jgi:hypothetical protein